jgi:hypothetical protein
MSKLASISSQPTMREYAQGAAQSATSRVADFLAPTVGVPTSVGRFKQYNEKHRFLIPDTRRAIGGRATELGFSAEDKTYNCEPHALDFPVDNLEKLESEDLENVLQEGADMIADVAALSHERRVIDLTLATLGQGTALSVGANDDIIDQLDAEILNVIKAAKYGALMGVGILFGSGAWRKVKNHASVRGRFVSGGKQQFANPSIKDFSKLLISDAECEVSLMVEDTAPEGKAEDIEFLLNGDIIIFARKANPTRRDPSFMKTFRLRNQWMVPGTYQRDDGRVEVAKFDWSCDVQVTNSTAGVRKTVNLS